MNKQSLKTILGRAQLKNRDRYDLEKHINDAYDKVKEFIGDNLEFGSLLKTIDAIDDKVNALKNAGYIYAGIATPTINIDTPNAKVFYIANDKGTYTNFGNIEVIEDDVVILYYDTTWHKVATGIASNDKLIELETKMAYKDGYYEGMTTGFSENLIDTKGDGIEQLFTYRTSCGSNSIADVGSALFKKLIGNSIVWNQLVYKVKQTETTTNGLTFYLQENGEVLITGTTTEDSYVSTEYFLGCGYTSVANHKAFIQIFGDTTGTIKLYVSDDIQTFTNLGIVQWGKTVANSILYIPEGYDCGQGIRLRFIAIDLTQMFGAGNEPSTVEEFKAMFPFPYYAYNAGQIIDNKVEEYQTIGFNQWDEEWELGEYDNFGRKIESSNAIRSKNMCSCLPHTSYHFKIPDKANGTYMGNCFFYDISGAFISKEPIGPSSFSTVTTPSNARFMTFMLRPEYGTTYNHDICVNISWSGYRNGEYEPYWKKVLHLGLNSFKVKDNKGNILTIEGLKSAGSVYDEIDLVRKKYIKRVGSVDMGEITWFQRIDISPSMFTSNDVAPNYKIGLCPIASINKDIYDAELVDGTFYWMKLYIMIYNSKFTNVDDFVNFVSGIPIYYELATYEEYDLVDDILDVLKVADFGTEYAFPTNEVDDAGVPKSAPFRAMIKYSEDMTRTIVNLPKNFQSQDSMDAMLTALGTALGFTWNKSWDTSNNKYNYTITTNK